jgi:hypothetical protein
MNTDLQRRTWLRYTAWLLAGGTVWAPALAQTGAASAAASPAPNALPPRVRLAAAWRGHGDTPDCGRDCDQVGVLELDWPARTVRVTSSLPVQGRAHGLLAEADGGFLAVATRPGRWLLRCDAQGQLVVRHRLDAETPLRTLGGHVLASADGQWLYTTETDTRDGSGWIGVREHRTLRRVAQWPTHGLDPHHLTLDTSGALLVLNGGIPRTADGRKTRLETMDPSLVRLDPRRGERLGQWRLDDPRLSLRHLAWGLPVQADEHGPARAPLLGIALQAEHDDAAQRRDAPLLALWDGQDLRLANRSVAGAGYAGDIAPGPGGGFIVSGQRSHEGLLWHPDAPERWTSIARLTEPCALAAWPDRGGVLMAAGRGIGFWHPALPPAMLPWPKAMAPDNHWVVLG